MIIYQGMKGDYCGGWEDLGPTITESQRDNYRAIRMVVVIPEPERVQRLENVLRDILRARTEPQLKWAVDRARKSGVL